jgi:hypothetical protein
MEFIYPYMNGIVGYLLFYYIHGVLPPPPITMIIESTVLERCIACGDIYNN